MLTNFCIPKKNKDAALVNKEMSILFKIKALREALERLSTIKRENYTLRTKEFFNLLYHQAERQRRLKQPFVKVQIRFLQKNQPANSKSFKEISIYQ